MAILDRHEDGLGLSGDVRQQRVEVQTANAVQFFRATPVLFHSDLQGAFRERSSLLGRPAPEVLIDGDSHLSNFGTQRGPDGHAVWGLNDFDQAGRGSPEWDLERLATSAVLVARQQGMSLSDQEDLVQAIGESYFDAIGDRAGGKDRPPALDAKHADGEVKKLIEKADGVHRKEQLAKLVDDPDSRSPRFLTSDELKPLPPARKAAVLDGLQAYGRGLSSDAPVAQPFQVLDVVQKLGSGGSSFGLERYYALVANADPKKPPVVLDVKLCLASPVGDAQRDPLGSDPSEIARQQRELMGAANPLTGEVVVDGRRLLARELEPEKDSLKPEKLGKKDLTSLASQAAKVLAGAHARTDEDASRLAEWVGGDASEATSNLWKFARDSADQTTADLAAYVHHAG